MRYLILVLVVVILSGCTLFNKPEPQVQKVDETGAASGTLIDADGDDAQLQKYIQYKNEKYGFELKLPGEWSGFEVEERVLNWGDNVYGNSMDFGFRKDGVLESLFNINVHTKESWQNIQKQEGPKPTFLGENEDYILAWDLSQSASDELMIARRSQASEIVASFQWIKK